MCKINKNLKQWTIHISPRSPDEKKIKRRAHVRATLVHDARLNEEGGVFREPHTAGAARRTTEKKVKEEKSPDEKPSTVIGRNSRGKMAVRAAGVHTPTRAGPSGIIKSPGSRGSRGSCSSDGTSAAPHRLGSLGSTPILKEGRLARRVRREALQRAAEAMQTLGASWRPLGTKRRSG